MNIIIIAEIDFPEGMAATALVSLMVNGLILNGVSCKLVIPSKTFNSDDKQQNKSEGVYNSIPYKFFNKYKTKKNTFTVNNMRNIIEIAKILKRRKNEGINDVVLTYNNDFLKNFPVFLTCYFYKIPLFPWEVEKRISNKEIGGYRKNIQKLGYRISDILLPKISTGYIVISTYLKEYYAQKINKNNIIVTPIMVNAYDSYFDDNLNIANDVRKYIIKLKDKYKIVVYSGSFGEKDGFPYILKAFKRLLTDYPNSYLVSTGKPGKYNPIEEILDTIKKMGLTNNFKYMGLVSREELKYINNKADVLLVCRSNSEYANYGFPWKLGEYLMTKNPIVATKVGDIERYLNENQEIILAEPENVDSIYEKMDYVLTNFDEAKKVAENGYLKATKVFDYKTLSKNVLEFITRNINFE